MSLDQAVLALALLYVPWHSYIEWQDNGRDELPVFSMMALMYWLYYAMPVFWGDRIVPELYYEIGREISDESITKAEAMALLGVCCMWLGFRMRSPQPIRSERFEMPYSQSRWNYLRFLLILGSLISLSDPSRAFLGEGGRQVLYLAATSIPTVVFAIFFRQFIRKKSQPFDNVLMTVFLVERFLAGISSGMLGSFGFIIVICSAIFISERRRIPGLALVSIAAFVLFFQPGKQEFRGVYWRDNVNASVSERVSFWVDRSFTKWKDALSDPTGEARKEILDQSLSRVSLLTASANVIDKTPSIIPYQYGRLYSYLAVTFVPRFLWPDKPSANEANQFYQIAYEISSEEQLSTVSIAIGILVEGFINFGWPGAAGIMFLLGIVLKFYQTSFFGKNAGFLMSAIGVVLLPQFLGIEVQLAGYIGGIVQQVFFTVLVMLPVVRIKKSCKRATDISRSSSLIEARPTPANSTS